MKINSSVNRDFFNVPSSIILKSSKIHDIDFPLVKVLFFYSLCVRFYCRCPLGCDCYSAYGRLPVLNVNYDARHLDRIWMANSLMNKQHAM
jgi:hypothetical protein